MNSILEKDFFSYGCNSSTNETAGAVYGKTDGERHGDENGQWWGYSSGYASRYVTCANLESGYRGVLVTAIFCISDLGVWSENG